MTFSSLHHQLLYKELKMKVCKSVQDVQIKTNSMNYLLFSDLIFQYGWINNRTVLMKQKGI